MAYVSKLHAYVPEQRVAIESIQEQLELKRHQIKLFHKIHGIQQICMDDNASLKQLLHHALQGLFDQHPDVDKKNIRYLIHCHTIQNISPYPLNILHELKQEFQLEDAISFSLTQQNCASSLTALDVANQLLSTDPDANHQVLVLTGEKAFTPVAQVIPNTTIMGEAATAFLVDRTGTNDRIITVKRKILGRYAFGIDIEPEDLRDFDLKYVPTLVEVMQEALDDAGITLDDLAVIIPHNVNLSSWNSVAKALPGSRDKIFMDNISHLGHCFCSDPFINYQEIVQANRLQKGDYYMMVAVGLGATFAVAILQH